MKSQMRRLRSIGLAVALGVGFLMAVLAFTDSLWHTVERELDAAFSGYDHVVAQQAPTTKDKGVDAELAEQVEGVPGVEAVTPSVNTTVFIERGLLQDPVGTRSLEWLPPEAELVEGERPGTGEILLDASVAHDLDLSVGETVRLLSSSTATEYGEAEISGLVDTPQVPAPNANNVLYGETDTLVEVLEHDRDGYSQLLIEASDPEEVGAQLHALAEGDTERDYTVAESEEFVSSQAQAALPGASQIVTGTVAVSALAFVVLLLVIRSVFTVRIEQDRREFSLHRCLGASRGQIFRSVLTEALAVGVVSSLLGVGVGLALLAGVFALPVVPLDFGITLSSVAIAVAAGVAVCVIGALGPAMQAMRSSPLGALRASAETGREQGAGARRSVWLRVAVLVLALTGLGLSATTGLLPGAILTSGVLVLAALSLIRPATVGATRLLLCLPWFNRNIALEEALERAGANPRRSASIVSLAAVTAAFVALVGTGSATVFASLDKLFSDAPIADVVITLDDEQTSGAQVLEVVDGLDSVGEAAVIDIVRVDAGATEMDPHHDLEGGRVVPVDTDLARVVNEPGHLDQVEPGTALLGEVFGLPDGDEVTFTSGGQSVQVEALVREEGTNYAFLHPDDHATLSSGETEQEVWLSYAEGVGQEQASGDLGAALSGKTVSYENSAQEMADFADFLDLITALTLLLLGVGVLIALVGISNTLKVSVLERRQEIGLQRALGAFRSTVRGALVTETLVLALLGCLIGLAVGCLVALGGVHSYAQLTPLLPFAPDLPVGLLLGTLLGTAAVAGAASLIAARNAVDVPPVAAITRE